jgi:hypothetical protein
LLSPLFLAIFAPAVAKVYIVSFRTHDDRRPSKFIVLADSMKSAINMGLEHGEKRKAKLPVQAINGQCLKMWVSARVGIGSRESVNATKPATFPKLVSSSRGQLKQILRQGV